MELFLYYLGWAAIYFIVFFFGIVYGWVLHQRVITHRIQRLMNNMTSELETEAIHISIEKDSSGMIYVYDKNSKMFMAQGKDRTEVEKILAEKYPGKKFMAPVGELSNAFSEFKE